MKIMVIGNMGYVGPVVVPRLLATLPEIEIYGFDAGFFGTCLTDAEALPETLLNRQYFGDVRAFEGDLLSGVDAVVHLAAISNDPISNLYEQVTYEVNHLATVAIAKEAKARGVKRFVFASSCSMYGLADEQPRAEVSQLNPLTPYAKSKVLAERDLEQLADGDFEVTCLRFATACGMSPRLRLDLALNDFVACAVSGQPITVLSDGTPWRPLIHVQDMARAIEWALTASPPRTDGFLAVNVGSDEWNYQVRELAQAVAESVAGSGGYSINTEAPHDSRSYRVDFGLYKLLAPNHQPQVDLRGAIADIEEGLRSMGFDDSDFRTSNLMRINHLNRLRASDELDGRLRWTGPRAAEA